MSILQLQYISKHFNGIKAVDDLTIEIEKGKITALIGPNGSGKTTVFNLITGFLKPDSGKILLNGKNISGHAPYSVFNYGIGRTFQNIRIFPQMSVLDNVLIGLKYAYGKSLWAALTKSKKMYEEEKRNIERAMELIMLVGLENKANSLAGDMSHGQRRLLELARIIGSNSDIFLFDEPTAGVFPNTIPMIINIIKQIKSQGKTILFIEHNLRVVMDISDKIIVLDSGKKIAEGAPTDIQANHQVLDAYMGTRRHFVA